MKKKSKTTVVTVPLKEDLFNALQSHCDATGETKTAVLRRLLIDWRIKLDNQSNSHLL